MYGQQNYGQQPPYGQNGGYGQQQQWGNPPPQNYQPGYQSGPPPVPNYNSYPSNNNNNNYGAPPPQQYGGHSPQPPYGAPQQNQNQYQPPPNNYGMPPPQQNNYGGHSPQPAYGAPAPQGTFAGGFASTAYGSSPQPGYNAPPQQQGFAGPQGGAGGPRFLGVSIPAPPPAVPTNNLPGYNPQFDAERIRKATKGFGTDETTLINTMAPLDAFQMAVLERTYEQTVGRTLKLTLEKELSGWLEYTLVLLSLGPLQGDVYLLHRACDGAGTHEDLLNEILLCRTNEEMFLLKEAYRRTYNKDMVKIVKGELSMKTERMFNMAMSGQRDESPFPNQQQVQQDIEALYRAGPGKIGTDEIAICGILLSRSDAHLKAIAQGFPARHRVNLSQMINSEFSGHMRDGLYFIARRFEADGDGVVRDAEYLQDAMRGMGTKDERLIYRLVRNHWNRPRFGAIKNQFQSLYGKTLRRAVEGETSGKYEKALVGIIEQN
ncbi:hypothetical protein IAT38_001502 [Cryptococcus sp. DSM 104549]